MRNNITPLVSIVVISYNSASTIAETLDSVAAQTYSNFEIIICDDGSKDETPNIIKEWIRNNENNIPETSIQLSKTNNGTSANCNKGLAVSKGEWLKFIAADDILLPNCIEENVKFAINTGNKIVQSRCILFRTDFTREEPIIEPSGVKEVFFSLNNSKAQYDFLLHKGNYIFAPAIFIEKFALESVGGYDERFPLMEDYPLWLKLLKSGYTFSLLPRVTVAYRQHDKSVLRDSKPFMNERFAEQSVYFLEEFFKGSERDFRVRKEIAKYKAVIALNKFGFNRPGLLPKILFASIFRI